MRGELALLQHGAEWALARAGLAARGLPRGRIDKTLLRQIPKYGQAEGHSTSYGIMALLVWVCGPQIRLRDWTVRPLTRKLTVSCCPALSAKMTT